MAKDNKLPDEDIDRIADAQDMDENDLDQSDRENLASQVDSDNE